MKPSPVRTLPFANRWDANCRAAFHQLKECLTTTPILGFPDFSKPFVVETDASFNGLGAVLSQDQDNGRVVVCYDSRSLKPAETNDANYSSFKLELLALKWTVTERFLGWVYFQTAKLGATESRWAAQLAQFDFDVNSAQVVLMGMLMHSVERLTMVMS